ncbi:hypothetical protein K1719_013069 [Acacia pycnantha]|nr:hypothetical protein K1719_013069 [Acacia pycnantha]
MGVNRANFCIFCLIVVIQDATDPNDVKILNDLENPKLLKWPDRGDDPSGSPSSKVRDSGAGEGEGETCIWTVD